MLGGNGSGKSALAAEFAVAAMLGKLIGGAWADRWSRTQSRARILVPSLGLFIAAPAVLLVAPEPDAALAVRLLQLVYLRMLLCQALMSCLK